MLHQLPQAAQRTVDTPGVSSGEVRLLARRAETEEDEVVLRIGAGIKRRPHFAVMLPGKSREKSEGDVVGVEFLCLLIRRRGRFLAGPGGLPLGWALRLATRIALRLFLPDELEVVDGHGELGTLGTGLFVIPRREG